MNQCHRQLTPTVHHGAAGIAGHLPMNCALVTHRVDHRFCGGGCRSPEALFVRQNGAQRI